MWVDGHVLFDVESGGATEYAYFTGTDRPHSLRRNGQTYYYLTDQLGSVAAVVDSTGTKRNTYTYDVWGYGSCSEQVGNRLRYTGREYDGATGFYYMRARYYDPSTGCFLSEDPLGGSNPYAYAGNNPVSLRDPSGLDGVDGDQDVSEWVAPPGCMERSCFVRQNEDGTESLVNCWCSKFSEFRLYERAIFGEYTAMGDHAFYPSYSLDAGLDYDLPQGEPVPLRCQVDMVAAGANIVGDILIAGVAVKVVTFA